MEDTRVVTFLMHKGGSGKTTSSLCTGLVLWRLGYKVCLIDLDSQGNLTRNFTGKSLAKMRHENVGGALDALLNMTPRDYILKFDDGLHLIPGSELMGMFNTKLTIEKHWEKMFKEKGWEYNYQSVIKKMTDQLRGDYDYIILDTPPALDLYIMNTIAAADFLVGPFSTDQYCYDGLDTFYETYEAVKAKSNPNLVINGVLIQMIDYRRKDHKKFINDVREHPIIGPYTYKTVINNNAATGRISSMGVINNAEIDVAIDPYVPYVKELLERDGR